MCKVCKFRAWCDNYFRICDAYAALVASGLTCVQETDCVADSNGDKCVLDSADGKYKCTVESLSSTACTDVTETSEGSGVFKSSEICDAFAAMKQAEAAALDAGTIGFDRDIFAGAPSLTHIKEKYNLILILNNSHYWKDIGYKKFSNKLFNKGIIYDFWASFRKDKYKKNYFRFGGGDLF